MEDTERGTERFREVPGWNQRDAGFQARLKRSTEGFIAMNLTNYVGGPVPVGTTPVPTIASVRDCFDHLKSQGMVKNIFDVKEVLEVMKRVHMTRSARTWIAKNPSLYVQGAVFGFTLAEGEHHDE
jgi:hypothetical protein